MDMPEKLELIAKCLREGRKVQFRHPEDVDDGHMEWKTLGTDRINFTFYKECHYRAKPEKPRTATVGPCMDNLYEAIEITPEVRKALEDAGIKF